MHLLYLAFFYPPSRASGAHRPRAFCSAFARSGWQVSVISAPLPYLEAVSAGLDPSTAVEIPGVDVLRPDWQRYSYTTDPDDLGLVDTWVPALRTKARSTLISRTLKERYTSWVATATRAGLRRARGRPVDAVLATGNPFASFMAARLIATRLRVPYALDYRDPWTFNSFTEEDFFAPGSLPVRAERWSLAGAERIIHVNDGLRAEYALRYPQDADRMIVIRNGFDADHLPEGRVPRAVDDGIRFGFVGTLTEVHPVRELLDGWRAAMAGPFADSGTRASLDIYGHLGFFASTRRLLEGQLSDPPPNLHYRGAVPKTAVHEKYDELDVLVFSSPGGRYVTGGKVYEYMATGLPIVSVHSPELAAVAELSDYPLWVQPESLAPADLAEAFARAAQLAASASPAERQAARAYGRSFDRESAVLPFAQQWAQRLESRS